MVPSKCIYRTRIYLQQLIIRYNLKMNSKKSIDDYESLDELITSQNDRKKYISDVLSLIQDQKHLENDIKYAITLVEKIKGSIKTAHEEVKKMKQLLPKVNILDEEVKILESKMSYIEKNLPSKFNKLLTLEDDYEKINISVEDAQTPLPIRRHLDFAEGVIPSAQKQFVHKDIQYLTQTEFCKIPGYMRGRVTYETINSFIDKINQCLEEKYSLLHIPKSSLKKRADQDKLSTYRRQECSKTKGKRFITQEDLKNVVGGKIDKHTLNLIPMLRHTRRLQELRDGGIIRYIALTDQLL